MAGPPRDVTADRRRSLGVLASVLVILAAIAVVMKPRIEGWIAGPLGREYRREITPCSRSSYEYCLHYIAVDTLDGRPVREGCGECLRRHGCDGALRCTMCGFDGR